MEARCYLVQAGQADRPNAMVPSCPLDQLDYQVPGRSSCGLATSLVRRLAYGSNAEQTAEQESEGVTAQTFAETRIRRRRTSKGDRRKKIDRLMKELQELLDEASSDGVGRPRHRAHGSLACPTSISSSASRNPFSEVGETTGFQIRLRNYGTKPADQSRGSVSRLSTNLELQRHGGSGRRA